MAETFKADRTMKIVKGDPDQPHLISTQTSQGHHTKFATFVLAPGYAEDCEKLFLMMRQKALVLPGVGKLRSGPTVAKRRNPWRPCGATASTCRSSASQTLSCSVARLSLAREKRSTSFLNACCRSCLTLRKVIVVERAFAKGS